MKIFVPSSFENKWQKRWKAAGFERVDLGKLDKKYYLLIELPYPSGDLHMGHWFTFAVSDILGRYNSMCGANVFMPIGFDAFGLPAENAAIKRGIHPKKWTYSNIERMKEQFATMGTLADFDRGAITSDPLYYRWNQWIFLKMHEKGLAYKGRTLSNWCPSCQTVLANENVEAGLCWRCGTEVVQKEVAQWFLKITEYAEKLLWGDPPKVDWPKALRDAQNYWIGKSEGTIIKFQISTGSTTSEIEVFTKFPETIFGVTYMVLAPEHLLLDEITTAENKAEVDQYKKLAQRKSELERTSLEKEKSGVFTGAYAINPVNNKKVPVWVADYVISTYGTGAVMGVPGSDVRDFAFAKKYGLEVIRVIGSKVGDQSPVKTANEVISDGWIVNSGQFDGLKAPLPAKEKFIKYLVDSDFAKSQVNYHLHDWSISRQRYWGTPIPIIYCANCAINAKRQTPNAKRKEGVGYVLVDGVEYAIVPVPEKDLPVELPEEVDWAPKGKPPLATAEDWVKVKCPVCGGEDARREVETMDTFIDSSWYFLRYVDPGNQREIFDSKKVNDWLPAEIYIGGAEHTLGHTLYSRFFVKFLHELGIISFDEYAKKRIHHGIILGVDGSKMSKSKGNVVNPDEEVAKYGADSVRTYLAFLGPYDIVAPWNPGGIKGVHNFYQRVWRLFSNSKFQTQNSKLDKETERIMHSTIKKVGGDIERIKFNTGVAAMMEWLNFLESKPNISKTELENFLLLLAPYGPHIAEELWEKIGGEFSIHNQPWPTYGEKIIEAGRVTLVVQINGKVRDKVEVKKGLSKTESEKAARARERIGKLLKDSKVKDVIYVQDRLINFVT